MVLAAILWHLLIFRLTPRLGLVKLNRTRPRIVTSSYGIAAFAYILPWHARWVAGVCGVGGCRLYLAVMGAMWALGIVDDVFGSREVGGFRGHFHEALREDTTGAAKAIGGELSGLARDGDFKGEC